MSLEQYTLVRQSSVITVLPKKFHAAVQKNIKDIHKPFGNTKEEQQETLLKVQAFLNEWRTKFETKSRGDIRIWDMHREEKYMVDELFKQAGECNIPDVILERIRQIQNDAERLIQHSYHERKEKNPSLVELIHKVKKDKDGTPEEVALVSEAFIDDIKKIAPLVLKERNEIPEMKIFHFGIDDHKHPALRHIFDLVRYAIENVLPKNIPFPIVNAAYKGGVARYTLKLLVYMIKIKLQRTQRKYEILQELRDNKRTKGTCTDEELQLLEEDDFKKEHLGDLAQYDFSQFNEKTLSAEETLSDIDVVLGKTETYEKYKFLDKPREEVQEEDLAKIDKYVLGGLMGSDTDGIEHMPDFDVRNPNFLPIEYFLTRDIYTNEVFASSTELWFTEEALKSVLTGNVQARGKAANLYGQDLFFYEGRKYIANKTMHRLVHALVKGQSLSFSISKYNLDIHMGIYWLVTLRKCLKKKNQNEQITRTYDLAKQMGQHYDTNSPREFLEVLTNKFPKFLFQDKQTPEEVAKWHCEKYEKVVHKALKQEFHIYPTGLDLRHTDDTELIIHLDHGNTELYSEKTYAEIQQFLDVFLEEDKRKIEAKRKRKSINKQEPEDHEMDETMMEALYESYEHERQVKMQKQLMGIGA